MHGEGQGKYKTFARYFGKDFTPFGFDVFTGMVLLYTRKTGDREEGTQRLLDAADRVLGDWKSFYHSFVRFLYGSVWTGGCIFRGVVKSGGQADFGLAAWV
ncbi:MAG: hypothetical protein ACLRZN_05955 [Dialister invisus]